MKIISDGVLMFDSCDIMSIKDLVKADDGLCKKQKTFPAFRPFRSHNNSIFRVWSLPLC